MEKEKSEGSRFMKVKMIRQESNSILYYVGYTPWSDRDLKLVHIGIIFCKALNRLTIQKNVFTNKEATFREIFFEEWKEEDMISCTCGENEQVRRQILL
ncbi:hypothetical protein LCGC14_3015810 [marine sediment metagenome]|uniref:Uncharacterized protein n=1 Tax=marine sediment metagenome TaxID=412755 RepID=A0A0F8XJM9_9ZZZZ